MLRDWADSVADPFPLDTRKWQGNDGRVFESVNPISIGFFLVKVIFAFSRY